MMENQYNAEDQFLKIRKEVDRKFVDKFIKYVYINNDDKKQELL